MSFKHGKDAEVVLGQYDLTEYFKEASLSASVETGETSTFRKDWKTFVAGVAGSDIDLDGFYDNGRSDEVMGLLGQETPYTATVGPAGLKAGDIAFLAQVRETSVDLGSPLTEVTSMGVGLQTTGEVFLGYGLKDVETAVTTDGTGTVVDTGAAVSSASWCFHYHLLAIDAGSVVITVQDSADGVTDWQPIASVTSGSLTASGAGRVPGTGTVRRYIRVSYDLTTATSVTFTAAFGRHA